ncbi:MAG: hypothetical protein FWC16_12735 [Defluviitaleaceae bacterium]|nr:hypothetical protein [Defluviitaleaceae bacterium]MCL2274651.1 hypothetical protein [Defluviitaleaceae bacterium]MCL2275788.1 hypothetical protein [Defluviitaleaceae bacterium]
MTESIAMLEIRKIKNENSLRYRKMSHEELTKEFDETTQKFIKRLGKNIEIVTLATTQN